MPIQAAPRYNRRAMISGSPFQTLILCSLALLCGLGAACVVPGEKTAIGRLKVEGRLIDSQGQPLAGREIVLLRPYGMHASKDERDAALDRLEKDRLIWKTNLWTDANGLFGYTFNAFVRDEPAWLFPPYTMFQEWNKPDPAVRLLVRTPGEAGYLYELIGKPAQEIPVRFYDPAIGRFRSPATNELPEQITVAIDQFDEKFPDNPAYTLRVNRIFLDIQRDERELSETLPLSPATLTADKPLAIPE
jgi:hypothetical protein